MGARGIWLSVRRPRCPVCPLCVTMQAVRVIKKVSRRRQPGNGNQAMAHVLRPSLPIIFRVLSTGGGRKSHLDSPINAPGVHPLWRPVGGGEEGGLSGLDHGGLKGRGRVLWSRNSEEGGGIIRKLVRDVLSVAALFHLHRSA